MHPNATATSAPARATASRPSVGWYRYAAEATNQIVADRYMPYAAGTWK
jgi:hypothetical protein